MKSSDPLRAAAEAVVERILALLAESQVGRAVDWPVDQALETFEGLAQPVHDRFGLHAVVGAFLRHVNEMKPGIPITLAPDQAISEAVRVLDDYQGPEHNGYRAALMAVLVRDFSNADGAPDELLASNGLEQVMLSVAFTLKLSGRQQYRIGVLAHHIDPCDWEMSCAVAAVLLDRLGLRERAEGPMTDDLLPPQNRDEQWAHDLLTLFDEVIRLETVSI